MSIWCPFRSGQPARGGRRDYRVPHTGRDPDRRSGIPRREARPPLRPRVVLRSAALRSIPMPFSSRSARFREEHVPSLRARHHTHLQRAREPRVTRGAGVWDRGGPRAARSRLRLPARNRRDLRGAGRGLRPAPLPPWVACHGRRLMTSCCTPRNRARPQRDRLPGLGSSQTS